MRPRLKWRCHSSTPALVMTPNWCASSMRSPLRKWFGTSTTPSWASPNNCRSRYINVSISSVYTNVCYKRAYFPFRCNSQSHGNRYMLIVRNVTVSDLSNYTCQATNHFGKDRAALTLSGIPSMCEFTDSVYTIYWHLFVLANNLFSINNYFAITM